MEKFNNVVIFLLKLYFSAIPTIFSLYAIGIIIYTVFSNITDPQLFWVVILLLSQICVFLLLIYYTNWAIWTKGIFKKIVFGIVMFFLLIFVTFLTM